MSDQINLGICPCGLCGVSVKVKQTQPKRGEGRPYYKCDACGFTAFCNMQESVVMMLGKLKQPVETKPSLEKKKPSNDDVPVDPSDQKTDKSGGLFW